PDQVAMRLGVPLLIAAVPQDTFYGISNDVLSPICVGLVFICLIKWFYQAKPSTFLGSATGLSITAAYLTKLSNLPLIVVAAGATNSSGTPRLLVTNASIYFTCFPPSAWF